MKYRWVEGSEGKWFLADVYEVDGARRRLGGSIRAVEMAYGEKAAMEIKEECDRSKSSGEPMARWPH